MSSPPPISKYRIPTARLTNKNRKVTNEYGLNIPPKNTSSYEPGLNEKAILMNSSGFNYKKQAVEQKAFNWSKYMNARVTMKQTNKVNTKPNNKSATRRVLFKRRQRKLK
jgi:hypothetical protein